MTISKIFFPAVILVLSASPVLAQKTYSDPVAYCKAVGTIDKPDARYTGPEAPSMDGQATEHAARSGQAHGMALRRWLCSRLPVRRQYSVRFERPSPARSRRQPISDYCKQNPGSDFVPMYVTGHDTAVSWACHGSTPAVIHSAQIDAQGYQANYWRKVSP